MLILLCVIVVLVLTSLVVVLTRGTAKPLEAHSPAGVVQGYVTAVVNGDEDAAREFLTAGNDKRCDELESVAPERNIRVALVRTTERASSADVVVSISYSNVSGPFGGPEYANEESFELTLVAGEWLISSAPWPLLVCADQGFTP